MALATYNDLAASISTWMARDMSALAADLVKLAEARVARDLRLRAQVAQTTLTTVAGTQTVALPSDWLETENIGLSSTTPPRALHVVTPELMDEKFPAGYSPGTPTDYCVVGTNLQLGPTPDAVYTIQLDYYQRFAALSGTGTNWLLTYHPNVYLWACLAEASLYMMDEQRATLWDAKYQNAVKLLQDTDDTAIHSGSSMRVRTV